MYIHEQFGSDPLGMKIVENAQRKIDNMIMEQKGDTNESTTQENHQPKIDALQIEKQKESIKNFINNRMTGSALNTMRNGQILALQSIQIEMFVGILGENTDGIRISHLLDSFCYQRYNFLRFSGAERTGHKVILHINYNKNFHIYLSFPY